MCLTLIYKCLLYEMRAWCYRYKSYAVIDFQCLICHNNNITYLSRKNTDLRSDFCAQSAQNAESAQGYSIYKQQLSMSVVKNVWAAEKFMNCWNNSNVVKECSVCVCVRARADDALSEWPSTVTCCSGRSISVWEKQKNHDVRNSIWNEH
jgi:hypothetical protein